MKLSRTMTEHIAKLSGLTLSEAELDAMTRDLGAVVQYMAVLESLDTKGVEPRPHILPDANVWRADDCAPSADRAGLLENAPAQQDGYVVVPRTVEGGQV